MNFKNILFKLLLTIPAIIFGIYITTIKPILTWMAKKTITQPLIILWTKNTNI